MSATHTQSKWDRLCRLGQIAQLEQLIKLKGKMPQEVLALELDAEMPPFKPQVFQLVVRPDGIWLHARAVRAWRKTEVFRFIADCDQPSDFRRANPLRR